MTKETLTRLIEARTTAEGLTPTRMAGVHLFRATQPIPCAPAVYEPSVIAITSGRKEALLEGARYVYDSSRYMVCPMSMPVKAGTPDAAPDAPLYGVNIQLDLRLMAELVLEMETAASSMPRATRDAMPDGIRLAQWDAGFTEALLRLLQLDESALDTAVLGAARLRELYYAILKGEAGLFARRALGAGNGIARSIAHMAGNLQAPISIDEMAARAGMSRAVFHRKFKQATTMSPIQFGKSMRLNTAATQIASGVSVNAAALDVGYVSPSQFSREFKRMYGQSPRQWSDAQDVAVRLA